MPIDPHFMLAIKASAASCEILDVLPETDLICELKTVVSKQFEIMCLMIEGKHYGSKNIQEFETYIEDLRRDIVQIHERE